jgi:hypothetical protein
MLQLLIKQLRTAPRNQWLWVHELQRMACLHVALRCNRQRLLLHVMPKHSTGHITATATANADTLDDLHHTKAASDVVQCGGQKADPGLRQATPTGLHSSAGEQVFAQGLLHHSCLLQPVASVGKAQDQLIVLNGLHRAQA